MQRIVAVILLCSLISHSLMKLGVVAWYELNKDYVAEVLCINKDKPELECNGKCYLNKQLKKADALTNDDNKNTPQKYKEIEVLTFLLSDYIQLPRSIILVNDVKHHIAYTRSLGIANVTDIFHPPC